jgi:hypothetical protein
VQLDTQEIEARGLWEVIPHALASGHTANAIIFAPGTLLALRKMEAEAIDWRRASHVKTALERLPDLVAHPTNRREDTKYPEDASRLQSQHFTSVAISKTTNTQHGVRQRDESEKRRGDGVGDFEKCNDDEALRTPVAQDNAAECGTKTTATREEIPVVAGGLARIAALLVAEGVSPSQAHKIARNVDAVRIEANLVLGAHVGKRNPGGYLAEAIRKDYAASAIKPGSEAAFAREREKPTRTVSVAARVPITALEAPEKPVVSSVIVGAAHLIDAAEKPAESPSTPAPTIGTSETASALLDALSEPEKAALRERAIMELDKQNVWMGASWKHEGAAFEGCVRGRMLKLAAENRLAASASSSAAPAPVQDVPIIPSSDVAPTPENAVSVGTHKPCATSDSGEGYSASAAPSTLKPLFRSDHDRRASRGGGLQRLTFAPLISSA